MRTFILFLPDPISYFSTRGWAPVLSSGAGKVAEGGSAGDGAGASFAASTEGWSSGFSTFVSTFGLGVGLSPVVGDGVEAFVVPNDVDT